MLGGPVTPAQAWCSSIVFATCQALGSLDTLQKYRRARFFAEICFCQLIPSPYQSSAFF